MMALKKIIKKRWIAYMLCMQIGLSGVSFASQAVFAEDEGVDSGLKAEAAEMEDGDIGTGIVKHNIVLEPGESYDCSKAETNTTVRINKAGTYELKGKSSYVRVLIEGGNVYIKLADGLNLNCGINAYGGTRTSPINITETGGTVTLISEKNAKIYFEGYMCPGIRKDGRLTALHFETEDTDNPGTIEAVAGKYTAGQWHSAAIGSTSEFIREHASTGNITINSGKIIAHAYSDAAGIGGGTYHGLDGLTINGGTVWAYGGGGGAAIGGGYQGVGRNITINGGEVSARCDDYDSGAAIGGGDAESYSDDCGYNGENITINGGDVTAITRGQSAAIGGGGGSDGKNIVINGGTINAHSRYEGMTYETGAAIGGSSGTYPGHATVKITGGIIHARADGKYAHAIGDMSKKKESGRPSGLEISGGTIICETPKSHSDIGMGMKDETGPGYSGKVVITGGSIYASHPFGTVVDGSGNDVHRVDVSFEGNSQDELPVSDLILQDRSISYGMKDVFTKNDGKIYPWLSSEVDNSILGASLADDYYIGSIAFRDSSGVLHLHKNIVLLPDEKHSTLGKGRAVAIKGENHLFAMKAPGCPKGYHIERYMLTDTSNTRIAEDDGSFDKGISGYTDNGGSWIREYNEGEEIDFRAGILPNRYKVCFDSNRPDGASTAVTGTMDEETMTYDENRDLDAIGYKLPGYTFQGWNTKADGKGTAYTNGQSVSNLTDENDSTVTLYAQWLPIMYQVNFDNGDGTGSMNPMSLHFDETGKLPKCGFTKEGYRFAGWEKEHSFGSSVYKDEDTVVNLCGNNPAVLQQEATEITLTAVWMPDSQVTVGVFDNDEPVTGYDVKISREQETHKLTEEAGKAGFYSIPIASNSETVTNGTYNITIEKDGNKYATDETVSVDVPRGDTLVLQYCSIFIEGENEKISGWAGNSGSSVLSRIPEGSQVKIGTKNIATGYHFSGYTATGVKPGWNPDPETENQNIDVNGQTVITVHPEANVYHVGYEPNGGRGQMMIQDMVYDQPQDLFVNEYKRRGYSFSGWKGQDGKNYTDGEKVINLSSENGGDFTMTAEWDIHTYSLEYDLNSGTMPEGKKNPETYTVETDSFTLINPEAPDGRYEFAGWTGTGLREAKPNITIEKGSTGDRAFKANWRLKEYCISYDLAGGKLDGKSGIIREKHKAGEIITVKNAPVRKGYKFKYWQGSKYYPGDSFVLTADHRLKAVWEKGDPATGDGTNIILGILLMLTSGAIIAIVLAAGRSRE